MSSRFTLDTNILRIHEVFALSPKTNDFIQPYSIPMIQNAGQLKWFSTTEFLSSISVPNTSTSVLLLLQSIQPGLSTLSSAIVSNLDSFFTSTVAGLGTAGYASTSYVQRIINELSGTYKFISSTTLYDCFAHLADMQWITNEAGPMISGTGLDGGYVSTVHPGEYKIYKSTLPLEGTNLTQQNFPNGNIQTTASIRIEGFSSHIVNSSKMSIDVLLNANLNFWNGLQDTCYFSTVLINTANNQPIGDAQIIHINPYMSNTFFGTAKFLVDSNDLTPFPNTLQLQHTQVNLFDDPCEFTTMIPVVGGIHVVLDNTD